MGWWLASSWSGPNGCATPTSTRSSSSSPMGGETSRSSARSRWSRHSALPSRSATSTFAPSSSTRRGTPPRPSSPASASSARTPSSAASVSTRAWTSPSAAAASTSASTISPRARSSPAWRGACAAGDGEAEDRGEASGAVKEVRMSSVLVTGSADGIGRETARTLIRMGHRVVVHARSGERAADVRKAIPDAAVVVVGELTSLDGTRGLAGEAGLHGPYDAVIHNAGVGGGVPRRELSADGLERIFQVNVLAPYLLTALMERPARLVYLTSGLEANGAVDLDDLQHERGQTCRSGQDLVLGRGFDPRRLHLMVNEL